MPPLPVHALSLFADQYGLLSRAQARDVLSEAERRVLSTHPDVEHISRRVFRHSAVPVTLGAQLLLPVLDATPRAWLWGASAARWWGFSRDRSPIVHVARVDGSYPKPLGRIHRIGRIDPCDVTLHHGIPIARPERVLLTLAAHETRRYRPSRLPERRNGEDLALLRPAIKKLEGVVDHAWSLGLIDAEFITSMVKRLQSRGRAGIVVLREALRDVGPDYVATDSGTERRFEDLLGVLADQFDRQVEISDDHGLIGRVDYLARRWPLVVEVNGELHHVTRSDRARDSRRYARLLAAGFSVVVVWQYDVWSAPDPVFRGVSGLLTNRDRVPTLHRPTAAPWQLLADSPGRVVSAIRPT